jgi:hypothetical protein
MVFIPEFLGDGLFLRGRVDVLEVGLCFSALFERTGCVRIVVTGRHWVRFGLGLFISEGMLRRLHSTCSMRIASIKSRLQGVIGFGFFEASSKL